MEGTLLCCIFYLLDFRSYQGVSVDSSLVGFQLRERSRNAYRKEHCRPTVWSLLLFVPIIFDLVKTASRNKLSEPLESRPLKPRPMLSNLSLASAYDPGHVSVGESSVVGSRSASTVCSSASSQLTCTWGISASLSVALHAPSYNLRLVCRLLSHVWPQVRMAFLDGMLVLVLATSSFIMSTREDDERPFFPILFLGV